VLQAIVGTCRMLKHTYKISPAQVVEVELRVTAEATRALIEKFKELVERMAKVKATLASGGDAAPGSAKAVVNSDVEVRLPLGGLIDAAAESKRIAKDLEKNQKDIEGIEKKLANADFVARAPDDVIAEQRARLAEYQAIRVRLADALATLAGAA